MASIRSHPPPLPACAEPQADVSPPRRISPYICCDTSPYNTKILRQHLQYVVLLKGQTKSIVNYQHNMVYHHNRKYSQPKRELRLPQYSSTTEEKPRNVVSANTLLTKKKSFLLQYIATDNVCFCPPRIKKTYRTTTKKHLHK